MENYAARKYELLSRSNLFCAVASFLYGNQSRKIRVMPTVVTAVLVVMTYILQILQ